MSDVNADGAEFASHALRKRSQAEFRARKSRKPRAAAQARGRAGEENAATTTGQHVPRRFASAEKAAETASGRVVNEYINVAKLVFNAGKGSIYLFFFCEVYGDGQARGW